MQSCPPPGESSLKPMVSRVGEVLRDRSVCLEAGAALPQPQVYFRPMPACQPVCQPLSWILLHPQSKPRSRAQISCHGRVVSHVIPKRKECKESLQHLRSLPCVLYLAAAKSPWLLPAPACPCLRLPQ